MEKWKHIEHQKEAFEPKCNELNATAGGNEYKELWGEAWHHAGNMYNAITREGGTSPMKAANPGIHVDDILARGKKQAVEEFFKQLEAIFEMKEVEYMTPGCRRTR